MTSFRSLILILFILSGVTSHAFRCENLFESEVYSWKPWNLFQHHFNETYQSSKEQVQTLNLKTETDVHGTLPPRHTKRAESISYDTAYDLLDIVNKHPVVGREGSRRFKRDGVEIGYCFGRATYLHLLLLKMGVQKESIRKVWAVGPATTNMQGVVWGFHVAIMVYTKEKGWVVIDTNEPKPMTYESWSRQYYTRSTDGLVRFYITEAEKFGVDTGPYRRVDLGLTLPADRDWYNHYFVEMLHSFKSEKLSDLGLEKLNHDENAIDYNNLYKPLRKPENFIESLIDLVWGLS